VIVRVMVMMWKLREVWFRVCLRVRRMRNPRYWMSVKVEGPVRAGEPLFWTGRLTWTGLPIVKGVSRLRDERMRSTRSEARSRERRAPEA
jgi:hypothetical protein